MKNLLKYICTPTYFVCTIFGLMFGYFFISIVSWDLSPGDWSELHRWIAMWIAVITGSSAAQRIEGRKSREKHDRDD